MKINEKLYIKYGTNTVILPPPLDESLDMEIPANQNLPDITDPDLDQMAETAFIYDRDQEMVQKMMKIRERKKMEKEIFDQIQKSERREQENSPTELVQAPSSVADPTPTVDLKRASVATERLLKKCQTYYALCRKL